MSGSVDQTALSRICKRETEIFLSRTAKSRALLDRAKVVMPDGVPMAWMAGLYRHQPIFVARGDGSRFEDVDGNVYIDLNLADLSNTIGHGDHAVTRAIRAQAELGLQFLLPTGDAIAVASALTRRTGLPQWQFTLSASGANIEVIRIARAFTGRQKIVLFDGKYHGHVDTLMAKGGGPDSNSAAYPEAMGISPRATADTVNVPFNDPEALALALRRGDVALVLIEPALTNCTLVLPEPGFLAEAYRLTK